MYILSSSSKKKGTILQRKHIFSKIWADLVWENKMSKAQLFNHWCVVLWFRNNFDQNLIQTVSSTPRPLKKALPCFSGTVGVTSKTSWSFGAAFRRMCSALSEPLPSVEALARQQVSGCRFSSVIFGFALAQ